MRIIPFVEPSPATNRRKGRKQLNINPSSAWSGAPN